MKENRMTTYENIRMTALDRIVKSAQLANTRGYYTDRLNDTVGNNGYYESVLSKNPYPVAASTANMSPEERKRRADQARAHRMALNRLTPKMRDYGISDFTRDFMEGSKYVYKQLPKGITTRSDPDLSSIKWHDGIAYRANQSREWPDDVERQYTQYPTSRELYLTERGRTGLPSRRPGALAQSDQYLDRYRSEYDVKNFNRPVIAPTATGKMLTGTYR